MRKQPFLCLMFLLCLPPIPALAQNTGNPTVPCNCGQPRFGQNTTANGPKHVTKMRVEKKQETAQTQAPISPPCDLCNQLQADREERKQMLMVLTNIVQTQQQMQKDQQAHQDAQDAALVAVIQDLAAGKKAEGQAHLLEAQNIEAVTPETRTLYMSMAHAYDRTHKYPKWEMINQTASTFLDPASTVLGNYFFGSKIKPNQENVNNSSLSGGISPGAINFSGGNASASSNSQGGNVGQVTANGGAAASSAVSGH